MGSELMMVQLWEREALSRDPSRQMKFGQAYRHDGSAREN